MSEPKTKDPPFSRISQVGEKWTNEKDRTGPYYIKTERVEREDE